MANPMLDEAPLEKAAQPLIGVTGARYYAAEFRNPPLNLLNSMIDTHYVTYVQAVANAGGMPVHLVREADAEAVVARLDGLVIAGGHDVDPRSYGRQPDARTSRVDPARDRFELDLIRAAIDSGVPLLGVCRGLQLMNVARGGTLIGDLVPVQGVEHTRTIYPSTARVHPVSFTPGSLLHGIYGDSVGVNSYHHQAIDDLGENVEVTGVAPDGTVEAIEVDSDAGAIGVQWHPELLDERAVFGWLVDSACQRAELGAFRRV